MSESGDYDPGPWRGHDFKDTRAHYDVHVGRSYDKAVAKKVAADDLVPNTIETKSTAPLVICCDVTGSMGEWPAVMFSKLPYLYKEGQEYLGQDMEISFCAVGDMFSDKYPLQVQVFDKGTDLIKRMEALVIEGGGGSQYRESYDAPALYYARNCKMPNAVKPIFIFIGDENLYNFVEKEKMDRCCKTDVEDQISVEQIFTELKRKFSVYCIRKPYGSGYKTNHKDSVDNGIEKAWTDLLGADHVCALPEAERVVDVIFGILAKETARIEYFKKEITDRQKHIKWML